MRHLIWIFFCLATPAQADNVIDQIDGLQDTYAMDIAQYPPLLGDALTSAQSRQFHERAVFRSPIPRNALLTSLGPEQLDAWGPMREGQAIMALSTRYDRQQIVALYLETAYFGRGCTGVSDAANGIFGVDVMDLSVLQQVALVSVLKSPARYWDDLPWLAQRMQVTAYGLQELGVSDAITDEIFAHPYELNFKDLGSCDTQ